MITLRLAVFGGFRCRDGASRSRSIGRSVVQWSSCLVRRVRLSSGPASLLLAVSPFVRTPISASFGALRCRDAGRRSPPPSLFITSSHVTATLVTSSLSVTKPVLLIVEAVFALLQGP